MLKYFCVAIVVVIGFFGYKWMLPLWYMPKGTFSQNHATIAYEIVAENLEVPWDIAFLPDGDMLVTERVGRLRRIGKNPQVIPFETSGIGEGGLMGLVLHPDFANNHLLYLYYTAENGNRVERYRYSDGALTEKMVIIEGIPSSFYHDGGRMAFGPDGYLYITTGDADQEELAQDIQSLVGKILRVRHDGTIPADNPFGNAVYSYGHRNPQGITWDAQNRLWCTEHGPSGFSSGEDELNMVEKGKNYGWPNNPSGSTPPTLQSGEDTWAPASALYWEGSIFFGGLRGQALYEAKIDTSPIVLKEHFKGTFGRIRTVVLGPDGYFYITTSNCDARGYPKSGDDKIIKIEPQKIGAVFSSSNIDPV